MKIAILTPLFPPEHLAGLEIAAYNIAKHLANKYEVHVITTLDRGLPKESIEEGFFVHRFKTSKIPILRTVSYCIKSFFVVKKINPDIVHIQTIFLALSGLLIKKFLRKPYVVYGRGSDVYLPWRFKNLISKPILKTADGVIGLTEDMKSEIQKIWNREVFVIPNGIDLKRFDNLSKEYLRSKLERNEEKIILFVGTLRPVKGLKYLIEAMKIITDKSKNSRLFIVGDGEERGYLENLVRNLNLEKYVKFVEKVPNEEVPEYMAASDVFVLPSLSEGFPVTVVEAMASGLPIVATDVRGLSEIIKNGENGFLVEPKNSIEIAEKVLLLLEDDELRRRISRNNKEEVKRYSWENIVENLEEVYLGCF
jgi:glycosyltransferase involved in cell wall biosynthesis